MKVILIFKFIISMPYRPLDGHYCIIFLRHRRNMADTLDLFRGFVCGTVSGWAQVVVMQPFEIIKVRLVNQSLLNPQYKGILDCFHQIRKKEGVRSFYKGKYSITKELSLLCSDMGYKDLWRLDLTSSSKNSSLF